MSIIYLYIRSVRGSSSRPGMHHSSPLSHPARNSHSAPPPSPRDSWDTRRWIPRTQVELSPLDYYSRTHHTRLLVFHYRNVVCGIQPRTSHRTTLESVVREKHVLRVTKIDTNVHDLRKRNMIAYPKNVLLRLYTCVVCVHTWQCVHTQIQLFASSCTFPYCVFKVCWMCTGHVTSLKSANGMYGLCLYIRDTPLESSFDTITHQTLAGWKMPLLMTIHTTNYIYKCTAC
jgi:hypothetical protein